MSNGSIGGLDVTLLLMNFHYNHTLIVEQAESQLIALYIEASNLHLANCLLLLVVEQEVQQRLLLRAIESHNFVGSWWLQDISNLLFGFIVLSLRAVEHCIAQLIGILVHFFI